MPDRPRACGQWSIAHRARVTDEPIGAISRVTEHFERHALDLDSDEVRDGTWAAEPGRADRHPRSDRARQRPVVQLRGRPGARRTPRPFRKTFFVPGSRGSTQARVQAALTGFP